MITQIEALNFRCLRYISQRLGPFHVLVGPNASGKTTFLDVVAFLGRLVQGGIEEAVGERTQNFQDLVWGRKGEAFELAIELRIPDELRQLLKAPDLDGSCFDTVRYEVSLASDPETREVAFRAEKALLKASTTAERNQKEIFPQSVSAPESILTPPRVPGQRLVLNKVVDGNDNFYSETYSKKGKGWVPAFKLGPRRSALANLPEDESKFPVATWLKGQLTSGVQQLVLNSLRIRKASPPGKGRDLASDGSNLPWAVGDLERTARARFDSWIAHLRTALPDFEGIRIVAREDDHHRYLMLLYRGGLEIPSWMASDGTLRLLALTLPAYLPGFKGIYLVEEPENGIHPRAVETMIQSLSSVYQAQILLATHSPIVLSTVQTRDLLCFGKTEEGSTDIVLGSEHPALRDWRGETHLSVLFAAGVLS